MNSVGGIRPRLLLVPDRTDWVVGTLAQHLAKRIHGFETRIISEFYARTFMEDYERFARGADIVHVMVPYHADLFDAAPEALRIATMYHLLPASHERFLATARAVDCVHVIATEWQEYALRNFQIDNVRMTPMLGVDTSAFAPASEMQRRRCRRRFGFNDEDWVIGFFGRSESPKDRKGLDVFADVIDVLAKRHRHPMVLTVGPHGQESMQLLRRMGSRCIHRPYVLSHSKLAQCYHALDAYCIASRVEGGPATLLEAMACGTPVVTTPVGIARDLATDGENALFFPKDDAYSAAEQMERLMDDPWLRGRLAQSGRETALRNDWDIRACEMERLYRELLLPREGGKTHAERTWEGTPYRLVQGHDLANMSRHLSSIGERRRAAWVAARAMAHAPFLGHSRRALAHALYAGRLVRLWGAAKRFAVMLFAGAGKESA